MNLHVAQARPASRDELVRECAQLLADAFAGYNAEFRAITQRARHRFESRDWRGSQKDAVERIELYEKYVQGTVEIMRRRLGDESRRRLPPRRPRVPVRRRTAPDRQPVRPAADVWLPRALAVSADRYGSIGPAFTYLAWLYVVAFVFVTAAVLGQVVASDTGRLGTWIRGDSRPPG